MTSNVVSEVVPCISGTDLRWTAADAPLGATLVRDGAQFVVWAPAAETVELRIVSPREQIVAMTRDENGYWKTAVAGLSAGVRYFLRLNSEKDRPDPASRSQPQGVHGPSELVDWQAKPGGHQTWRGPILRDYVLYELHVGTFTPEGTLDAILPCLDRLHRLGITAIELMPVAEFPGGRNWGYDGVFPFAVERQYGGVAALRRVARACHERGMALVLDVVYNHLGPEGNYLSEFGPYFTGRYRTPWGGAINFDGAGSDEVRRYFLENALYWIRDCEVDALRLDAVHAMYDRSAYPFLQELADKVHAFAGESGRNVYLIAESDMNDARLVRCKDEGGIGIDAQWADDLHHTIHTLLTGESTGYYGDFGRVEDFAGALRYGWLYTGQYSRTRQRRFGSRTEGLGPEQFVVCSQNHDQAGNRMKGERLEHLVGFEKAKLAAAAYLLSPFTPLIFMGEEYADPAPFLFFVSHTDSQVQQLTRIGRREEFAAFMHQGEPPDPQEEATFLRSKLHQELAEREPHATMHRLYAELIRLRHAHPAVREMAGQKVAVLGRLVEARRSTNGCSIRVLFNLGDEPAPVSMDGYRLAFRTSAFDGTSVAPWSCILLTNCRHSL